MKLFFTGTDSLMLLDVSRRSFKKKIVWLLFRLIIRVLDRYYIESYLADHELIKDRLQRFGVTKPIKVVNDEIKHKRKLPKVKHKGFNILYYFPEKTSDIEFWKWVYGYDIFEAVINEFPECNFIRVDGSQDLNIVFPITDFYLRPNRSDGASRLRQECEIQEIPYYWSQQNPNLDEIFQEIKNRIAEKASV